MFLRESRLLGLTLCAVLSPFRVAAAPPDGSAVYVVDPARSTVSIRVGRAGLFKFAGHEHLVLARAFRGAIQAEPVDLGRSSVRLTFDAGALAVSTRDEPAGDAPKVQARMLGPDVLDVARFPEVAFRSTAVEGRPAGAGGYHLRVTGELGIHGATRSVVVPVEVALSGATLTASGRFELRQTDYGMQPVSVAGVVKVKDALVVEFRIVATHEAGPARTGSSGSGAQNRRR